MIEPDVIVVGGGGMGTAAAWQLARRGARTMLLEQFSPGHDRGSSHGESRIIRLAYFEHPDYVPLLRAAYALWRETERASGEALLTITGGLELGPEGGVLVQGNLASARRHGLEHELLDAAAIRARLPAFRAEAGEAGVFQPESGVLAVERCVRAQAALARAAGADVREGVSVRAVLPDGGGVRVESDAGVFRAGRAVVAAGPWAGRLLASLGLPLVVARQTVAWFAPRRADLFAPGRFPIFIWERPEGFFYGFPIVGRPGVKVARPGGGAAVTPETVDREFHAADEAPLRRFLERCLPEAAGELLGGSVCLYTNTPDGDFVIDLHPGAPQIALAAGFSGHGFKFAPVVGAILADLALAGRTAHPIGRFRAARFG
jgi:sarcosine oxidase